MADGCLPFDGAGRLMDLNLYHDLTSSPRARSLRSGHASPPSRDITATPQAPNAKTPGEEVEEEEKQVLNIRYKQEA